MSTRDLVVLSLILIPASLWVYLLWSHRRDNPIRCLTLGIIKSLDTNPGDWVMSKASGEPYVYTHKDGLAVLCDLWGYPIQIIIKGATPNHRENTAICAALERHCLWRIAEVERERAAVVNPLLGSFVKLGCPEGEGSDGRSS